MEKEMNLQSIVTWVGIAGGVAGVGFPAYTTHKQDQADLAAQRQAEVQRAVKEQEDHDRLWRTLDEYKRHLQMLDENLPAQQKKIARAVFARMQVEQDMQPAMEKAMPVIAERRMHNMPSVAADAPAEETPQP